MQPQSHNALVRHPCPSGTAKNVSAQLPQPLHEEGVNLLQQINPTTLLPTFHSPYREEISRKRPMDGEKSGYTTS